MPMPADDALATPLAITGGAGALGRHVIARLRDDGHRISALVHRTPLPRHLAGDSVAECAGSLLDRASLERWLPRHCIVVHLAYAGAMSADDHARAVDTLADACAAAGVRGLVHVSTAVVAGRTTARLVNEDTPCEPATEYERAKYGIEGRVERAAAGRFPLVIARPTAIFGPGLRNLVVLAESVRRGGLAHLLRASLSGRRQMHLVPVDTVARALAFLARGLAGSHGQSGGVERFLVSIDTDPGGDFESVERRLRQAMGVPTPALRRLPIPVAALRLALRVVGRSDVDPDRIYDGTRLRRAGFVPTTPIERAIDEFAEWYLAGHGGAPAPARS